MSGTIWGKPSRRLSVAMAFDKSSLKYSVDHVPATIQAELTSAMEIIHQTCKGMVAMVWLFGSYARGDYINDRRVDENGLVSEYNSDVDVLVVLKNDPSLKGQKQLSRLSNMFNKAVDKIQAAPQITQTFHLVHEDLARFNQALNRSEYFYLDVVNEGIVLFDDHTPMAQPQQLSQAQRREMSIEYFERFYGSAVEFQKNFEFAYQTHSDSIAMFTLHQITERLFYTYLLVHTHYKPRTHKLYELKERVAVLDSEILSIFPSSDPKDKKHFSFFCDAYVDSRYKTNYTVEPETLDVLTDWVSRFQHWVFHESLNSIDNFVPGQNYSNSYQPDYVFLDLQRLKDTPLPEVEVLRQKDEIEALKRKLRDAGLE